MSKLKSTPLIKIDSIKENRLINEKISLIDSISDELSSI